MRRFAAVAGLFLATGAAAQERDYCPARPGLGTPACTMAPGRLSVETGAIDWQRESDPTERTDTIAFAATQLRYGLSDTIEAQLSWTPVGQVNDRDRIARVADHATGVGDVTLGFKANIADPDGHGLSMAVQPAVIVPTGKSPIGGGDWAAGLTLPVTYDISDAVNLEFVPEVDAAVDEDGHGRHLAYSLVVGIGVALTKALQMEAEVQGLRDRDPEEHSSQALAALSLAWMAKDDLQFDVGVAAGLDKDAPDARAYAGFSRRF